MKFNELDQNVESRLNLKPNKLTFGLALAQLEEVVVKDFEVPLLDEKTGAESKSEFKGITVPRLSITWKNYKQNPEEEDRYHTESWGVIVTTKNDGTPMDKKTLDSLYSGMWASLIHIYNSYKKCPNYAPITSFPDIDEMATPTARAKQTKAFFETFANAFNGKDGKAVFVNDKGEKIPSWLKLVAEYKTQKRYTIPTFVGQGFTEVAIKDETGKFKKPLIELGPKDSIELVTGDSKKPNNANISTTSTGNSSELDDILKQYAQ